MILIGDILRGPAGVCYLVGDIVTTRAAPYDPAIGSVQAVRCESDGSPIISPGRTPIRPVSFPPEEVTGLDVIGSDPDMGELMRCILTGSYVDQYGKCHAHDPEIHPARIERWMREGTLISTFVHPSQGPPVGRQPWFRWTKVYCRPDGGYMGVQMHGSARIYLPYPYTFRTLSEAEALTEATRERTYGDSILRPRRTLDGDRLTWTCRPAESTA